MRQQQHLGSFEILGRGAGWFEAQIADGLGPQAPGIQYLLHAQQGAQPSKEGGLVHGLHQEVIRPGIKAAHPFALVIKRCDHDHGDMRRAELRLQAPAGFKAIHARHQHIKQNDIG